MSYQKTGIRALEGVILGQPCTRVVTGGFRAADMDAIAGLAIDLGLTTVRQPCGLCPARDNISTGACAGAALAYGPCGYNESTQLMVWVADEYVPMLAMRLGEGGDN